MFLSEAKTVAYKDMIMMSTTRLIWNVEIKFLIGMLLLIAGVFFNTLAQAENLSKELIYCPEEINCAIENDLDSCGYEQNPPIFWNKIVSATDVKAGKYKFYHVDSSYHQTYVNVTNCNYVNENSSKSFLILQSKLEANLEAFYTQDTNWGVERFEAFCNGKSLKCPLKEQSAINIDNKTEAAFGFYTNINGAPPYGVYLANNYFSKIIYDNFWFCNGEDSCSVYICVLDNDLFCNHYYDSAGNLKYDIVGSVEVNAAEGLRIMSIKPYDYSTYNIQKYEPFNSIKIEKTHTFPDYSIEFVNWLNTNLYVKVENSWLVQIIQNGNSGIAKYADVYKSCKSADKCTLVVTTDSGVKVGDILVDMQNEMAILNVVSTRPSEVLITQIGTNQIEIKYTNLR
jgi:hypothetical protein